MNLYKKVLAPVVLTGALMLAPAAAAYSVEPAAVPATAVKLAGPMKMEVIGESTLLDDGNFVEILDADSFSSGFASKMASAQREISANSDVNTVFLAYRTSSSNMNNLTDALVDEYITASGNKKVIVVAMNTFPDARGVGMSASREAGLSDENFAALYSNVSVRVAAAHDPEQLSDELLTSFAEIKSAVVDGQTVPNYSAENESSSAGGGLSESPSESDSFGSFGVMNLLTPLVILIFAGVVFGLLDKGVKKATVAGKNAANHVRETVSEHVDDLDSLRSKAANSAAESPFAKKAEKLLSDSGVAIPGFSADNSDDPLGLADMDAFKAPAQRTEDDKSETSKSLHEVMAENVENVIDEVQSKAVPGLPGVSDVAVPKVSSGKGNIDSIFGTEKLGDDLTDLFSNIGGGTSDSTLDSGDLFGSLGN